MRKKSVEIDLGGKPRFLKLNLNAVATFEDRTGKSMAEMRDELGRVPVSTLRVLLWALLITDEPKLSIEQAGEMVDFDNLGYVSEKLSEVMKNATSKGDSIVAEDPLPQEIPASAGTR
jgi:hypothetical protein